MKIELTFSFYLFHHCTSSPGKQEFLRTDGCLSAFFSNWILNAADKPEWTYTSWITWEFWNSRPAKEQLGTLNTLGEATNSTPICVFPYQTFIIHFGLVEMSFFLDNLTFSSNKQFCMVHIFVANTHMYSLSTHDYKYQNFFPVFWRQKSADFDWFWKKKDLGWMWQWIRFPLSQKITLFWKVWNTKIRLVRQLSLICSRQDRSMP